MFPELFLISLISLGIILLALGTILVLKWNQSLDNALYRDNIILENISINGTKTIKSNDVNISDISRIPLLAIKSSSLKIPLKVDVKSLSGKIVTQYSFHGDLFVQPKIKSLGKYYLFISNLDREQVKISALFGYLNVVSLNDQSEVSSALQENTTGARLIFLGGALLVAALVFRITLLVLKGKS